ncbi:hypothetical protein D3C76_1582200 [compost metagenome]
MPVAIKSTTRLALRMVLEMNTTGAVSAVIGAALTNIQSELIRPSFPKETE